MRQFFGVLLLIGGAIGAFFAIGSVLWQQRAIHEFVPVEAQILRTEVRRHPGKSTTYSPEITYHYMVNGRQYESTRVLPVNENGNRNWAAGIVARYERGRPGAAATAYINPDNPAESILVREYSGTPYGFSMAALLVAEIGVGLLTGIISSGRQKMIALPLDESGWQLVLPTKSLRKNLVDSVAWFIGSTLAIALPLLHWLFVANRLDAKSLVLTGILAVGPMVLFMIMLRRWSVSRHLSDARVRVRPAPMKRGEPLAIEAEVDAYSLLRVTEMRAEVFCIEHYRERRGNKTQVGTRTKAQSAAILASETEIPAGQVLAGKGEVRFDMDVPPTTDITIKIYPFYTWELRVNVKLGGMVDYRATFPLETE